ncbi:MAG: hypothetical protein K2W92_01340 [Alphaproteobacteria bacterium]|nr:hypothetical protein [Alphaproteobacteria bacterium]
MKNSLRKFFFNSTLTGSLCSLWIIPSLATQDDLEWQEAFETRCVLKDHLKRKGYKKENLLEVGKKFANSNYKLSSLASQDLNVWARGARLGRLSALYNIGRFVSTQKEEGYEWNPKITKILQRLKENEDSSKPSIIEQGLQHYLKTREVPIEYSEGQKLSQKIDESELEVVHGRKETQTYLEYLEEIEIEKKRLEEEKRQKVEVEKCQKIAEERARVEEEEERRRQVELKFQEELIAKCKKLEEEFNKELEARKKADEEARQKQATEAIAKLTAEHLAAEEQFQKELVDKKKVAEDHLAQEIAAKKAAAEEVALKQAIEAKDKFDAELKATVEKFHKELITKRQAVEAELEARKKADEEARQKQATEAIAKLTAEHLAAEEQFQKELVDKKKVAEDHLAQEIAAKKAVIEGAI